MSAYRESLEAPCHLCEDLTQSTCDLCRRPTCKLHFVPDVQEAPTCRTCGEAYRAHMKGGSLVPMAMLVVAAFLFAMQVTIAYVPLIIALPFVVGPLVKTFENRRRRRQFFQIMRERGALPAPKAPVPDDHADAARLVAKLEKQIKRK